VLDYKIEKRREAMQQFELQKIQEGAASNAQVAQVTEQMKQQTIQFQLEADIVRINTEMQWQFEIERMKKGHDLQGEIMQTEGRNLDNQTQSMAKVIAGRIAADASIEKQKIANNKPKTPAKK
jgi:hypothetical protein